MRGNEKIVLRGIEGYLQKFLGIKTEDRPAVGFEIADFCERKIEPGSRGKVGRENYGVNLSRFSVLAVNAAYFGREDEKDLRPAGSREQSSVRNSFFSVNKPLPAGSSFSSSSFNHPG